MSWRLTSRDGFRRYRTRCIDCGELQGWPLKSAAEQHLLELGGMGTEVQGDYAQEYEDGNDGTCPHAESAPPPKERKLPDASPRPRRRSRRKT